MPPKDRIAGFDLARAYAIFGMFIVNFNVVFGNYHDQSFWAQTLAAFSGNSSTVFVLLAGMGLALMSNRLEYSAVERQRLRSIINKRALFLFCLGLLLYNWWPADILHFYGGYMHVGLLLLFVNKRYYLVSAIVAVLFFHLLVLVLPYETGWDFETLQYLDFWTLEGFVRNTFYNGWNPIFPWLAYYTVGMYLGRLDLTSFQVRLRIFGIGFLLYAVTWAAQSWSANAPISNDLKLFFSADYLPPFLPFLLSTMGSGLMLITFFLQISGYLNRFRWAQLFTATGQMTLTHYLSHILLGLPLLALLTDSPLAFDLDKMQYVRPEFILLFATVYFAASSLISYYWLKKFKHGPIEQLMRKLSDR